MTTADYKEKLLPKLPQQPGVYKFINGEGKVIYVGKAKNLKSRVSSYFTSGKSISYKTRTMVKKAKHLEFIIVDNEHDALLLENTLIKNIKPRFNVIFRDDKSYTYICVKNERFPRVFFTRRRVKDGSTYYGPYTSKYKARIVLDIIRQLFQLRTCKLNLSEKNIRAGKFKVCLEYHIENCKGPCEGLESEEEYNEKIVQVKNMLKGNFGDVKRHIKKQMKEEAKNMNYEEAQKWKVRLEAFKDYQSKSMVVSPRVEDVDVYSITGDEKYAFVNYIRVVNGVMINTYTIELKKNLNEDEQELLEMAIVDLRQRFDSDAPEIIVPFDIDYPDENVKVKVPKRGDKRKLLELSQKNVSYFKKQKDRDLQTRENRLTAAERKLNTLKSDLQLDSVPTHIECFDNSNIQGSNPVAACVVFKNAKPSKNDYRKFNIKTVEGPDDYASMEEVVFRRYKRLKEEDAPLPQLVVIDGGKGQLNAAVKSIRKLDLQDKIKVIGIAKRLEEIFFPGDPIPLYIDKKSESLKLIQQLRNEAHRFAVKFHRDKRSSGFADTELKNIKGVGEKTSRKLLTEFGSVRKLKETSYADIEKLTGPSVARKIKRYFEEKADYSSGSDVDNSKS